MTKSAAILTWIRLLAGGVAGASIANYIWKRINQSIDEDVWVKYLADAPLKSPKDQSTSFKAGDLWQDKPVLILALRKPWCTNRHDAAAKVSALVKPELDKRGIALYAVTGDPWLVTGLYRNLKGGDVFVDVEQRFFRPKNTDLKKRKVYPKNASEEEKLFDGFFIIRGGNIIFQMQSEELKGDLNLTDILTVVRKLKVSR